jgi:tetratricopeptide (TPR) repeat protein
LLIAIAGVGVLGVSAFVASLWLNLGSFKQPSVTDRRIREYERILQSEPNNFDASLNLANLRIQLGQPDRAIPVMEKLVQQKPGNIDLQLTLAQLYKLTDQKQKAEIAYDQVLAQQKNNLAALVNKAVLRSQQGDNQTAKKLLAQAEKAAPAKLKENVRAIAENTLPSNTKPTSATK